MAVKAKMRVTGYHQRTNGGYEAAVSVVEVTMQPVYGEGEDKANAEWSKWTPSGELRLSITNPEAYKQFKVGQVVMLTMEPELAG